MWTSRSFFRLTLRLRLRRSPAEMSLPPEATLLQLRICDWTSCMIFIYSVTVVHNYYILLIKSTRHQNVFFNKLYGGCAFQITSRAVLKFSRYNRGLRYTGRITIAKTVLKYLQNDWLDFSISQCHKSWRQLSGLRLLLTGVGLQEKSTVTNRCNRQREHVRNAAC